MTSQRRPDRETRDRRPRRARASSLESIYFGHGPSGHGPTGHGSSRGHSSTGARSDDDRRARQLCRQVREQLELAIGELDDPLLDGVSIVDVISIGNHMLRVELVVDGPHPIEAVRERLSAVRGRLRSETAAAISRKRTPMLELVVMPTGAWRRDEEDNTDEP